VDLLGLVGEDAGAIGDLLELIFRIVVVEALGDASPAPIPVELSLVAAKVGAGSLPRRRWQPAP